MTLNLYVIFYVFKLMPILACLIHNNNTSIIKRNKMQEDEPPYLILL